MNIDVFISEKITMIYLYLHTAYIIFLVWPWHGVACPSLFICDLVFIVNGNQTNFQYPAIGLLIILEVLALYETSKCEVLVKTDKKLQGGKVKTGQSLSSLSFKNKFVVEPQLHFTLFV